VVEAGYGLLLSVGVDLGCATFMARRHSAVGEDMRGWWGLLLKRGADPDVGDQEGKKPLHVATQLGRAELAELLIRYGAGPKAGDNNR
jgi:Ankyrin repeat.